MVHSPLVRMVLAAYLALWSPAWCCCAVKMRLGRMTGVEAAACGSHGCCSATASAANTIDESISLASETPSSCCESITEDDSSPPSPEERPCRCHESDQERTRLDTGTKIILPGLSIAFASGFDDACLMQDSIVRDAARRGLMPLNRPPPLQSPRSLLAQHCLLVI